MPEGTREGAYMEHPDDKLRREIFADKMRMRGHNRRHEVLSAQGYMIKIKVAFAALAKIVTRRIAALSGKFD